MITPPDVDAVIFDYLKGTTLIVVCGWCPKPAVPDTRPNLTHGICPACVAKFETGGRG